MFKIFSGTTRLAVLQKHTRLALNMQSAQAHTIQSTLCNSSFAGLFKKLMHMT